MRPFIALCAACVVAALLGGCPNARKDAHCSPDEASIAVSPDCIYAGNGMGPRFTEDACPAPAGKKPADCTKTYAAVIDLIGTNCTQTACHGVATTASVGLYLDTGDPQGLYDVLTSETGSVGTPYVVADDPGTADNEALGSWIQCNVVAAPGGGFPMPTWSGLPNPADAAVVDNWLLCGAPGPK